MKEINQKGRDGVLVIGYVMFLLGSAYFVPFLWFFVEKHVFWSNLLPEILAALFFILPIRLLFKEPFRIPSFMVSGALFFYGMTRIQRAVEQIHFIEYGMLAFFLFRFLKHSLKSPWSYAGSVAGAFGVGVVDELIQGLLPNRFFDPRDIWINLWSAALGMMVIATLSMPRTL